MKIESLKSGDLRIWMTDHELERWGLELYDLYEATPSADRAVRRLLSVARQRIPFRSFGTVRVETLPVQGGVFFLFIPQHVYASAPAARLYGLSSAEDVLRVAYCLAQTPQRLPYASLYVDGDRFYLVVYPLPGDTRRIYQLLSEFGYTTRADAATVAYMEEHTRPLAVGDALDRLVTACGSRLPELQDRES